MLLIRKKDRKANTRPIDIEMYQTVPGPSQRAYPCDVHDDPFFRLCGRAEEDTNFLNVIESLRRGELSRAAGREFLNMDGPLYHDTRQQAIMGAVGANITGATTDKMIHLAAFTNVPAMYFSVAKKVRQVVASSVTHGATVGNITIDVYYGSTDAGTTLLCSSAAFAGVNAGVGPYVLTAFGLSRGGAVPTAVPMVAYGTTSFSIATVLAATGYPAFPSAAIAPVNIDATAALGFTIQVKNSGANASTYATHDITFEALN